MSRARAVRVGLCVATVLLPAFAWAAEPSVPRTRRVGVLPVKHFARPQSTLFQPEVERPTELTERLEQFLIERLAVDPNLTVEGPEALAKHVQVTRKEETVRALDSMQRGRALYEQLQVTDAIAELKQAHAALMAEYHDVVAPETVSELALLLALSHAETRESPEVHTWLKDMYRHTPWRGFREGFYSNEFEDKLRSALYDFRDNTPKDTPLGGAERRERFMDVTGIDVVVYAWIETRGGSDVLGIRIFDRHSREAAQELRFGSADSAELRERLDRFLSAWATCLPTRDAPVPPPEVPQNRFFIDTGFAYSLYAKDTTRQPFHNLGMGLAAEYQFLSGLGSFVQVNMFTSTLDPQRDLLDTFTSIRTIFGVSYAFRGSWWRLYARGGFDIQFLGNYSTTTDPWCKWVGRDDPACVGGITDLDDEITMGFHGALGVQFFMNRNIYATLRISATSYIIPLDQSIELNFPVTGELALGYSF